MTIRSQAATEPAVEPTAPAPSKANEPEPVAPSKATEPPAVAPSKATEAVSEGPGGVRSKQPPGSPRTARSRSAGPFLRASSRPLLELLVVDGKRRTANSDGRRAAGVPGAR